MFSDVKAASLDRKLKRKFRSAMAGCTAGGNFDGFLRRLSV